MQILCEISVTENTTQILDGQTKLEALPPPFLPRAPFSSITAVIKLASKHVLRLSDGEIFPLKSCSVLSIISGELLCALHNFYKHFWRSTVSNASITVNSLAVI
jgi:hypothetical protein